MNIEIRKEELEQLILAHIEKQVGETFTMSKLKIHEKGFYPASVDWGNLKDVSVEVTF